MTLNRDLVLEEKWKIIKYERYLSTLKNNIEYHKKKSEELQKHLVECQDGFDFYKKYGHSKNGFSLLDYKHNTELI